MAGEALRREIGEIPAVLARILAQSPLELDQVGAALGQPRRVWVLGNGTSYHAALGAATLAQRLAPPTGPQVIALPAHSFLCNPPALGPGDLVVGISASGKSPDVLAAATLAQGAGAAFLGLTNEPASPLGALGVPLLSLHSGPMLVPPTTKTYVASLLVLYLLVGRLLRGSALADLPDLAGLPHLAAEALAAAPDRVAPLVAPLMAARRCLVYGAGPLYPLALELALKLKEMALLHAEAVETGEMLHGPIAVIDGDTCVLGLVGPGDETDLLARVERAVTALGGRHFTLTSGDGDRWLSPFLLATQGYLIGWQGAVRRGLNPDQPDWYALYLSTVHGRTGGNA